MVADFLESDGWEVLQLGPDTPAADLAALSTASARTWSPSAAPRPPRCPGSWTSSTASDACARARASWSAGVLDGETSRAAQELGADVVVRDLRDLTAVLRDRIPPPEP